MNKNGATLIAAERTRQIFFENFNNAHDDAQFEGQLSEAAVSYAKCASGQEYYGDSRGDVASEPYDWPWDSMWWKPSDDPIKNLVKAGALIAAEIDRIQRKRQREQSETLVS